MQRSLGTNVPSLVELRADVEVKRRHYTEALESYANKGAMQLVEGVAIEDTGAAIVAAGTMASFLIQLPRLAYEEARDRLREAEDIEREKRSERIQRGMLFASWASLVVAIAAVVVAYLHR